MTTQIGSLAVSLSLDASNFNGSMAQVDRNLRGMGSELKAAKALGLDYGKSLDGLKSKKDILTRSVEASSIKLSEERKKYDELVASGKASEAQLERQAKKVNDAQAGYNRLTTELNEVDKALKIQSSSWTQFGEKMEAAGNKMKTVGKGMEETGKNLSMKITAPLLALGTGAFKAAVDFEAGMAGVRKTTDLTDAEFAALTQGIRDMAKELPSSAANIAAVAEQAGQLGIEKESILGFTRTIIDLSEATNLTAEQASTEFARFANIVGMSQKDFDRLGSSTVALGNSMATTESEIVSMGMRLAAQGVQVGMSEAQIMALAGSMSSLGIQAEMGGTAMTTILKKIDKAVGEGGKSIAAFAKAAGVSSKEFSEAWKNDPIMALDLFVKGLDKSSKEGKNLTTILTDLGIKGVYESDVLLRMAGASDLLAVAVETASTAWVENNALTNEAAERYKTTASQLKMLWNQIVDVGISFGDIMIPMAQEAVAALKPLIEQFGSLDREQQKVILTMAGYAAAAGPVLNITGQLSSTIGNTMLITSNLTKGIAGAGGLTAAITGLANPIGITVAAIGALSLGIYALNKASQDNVEDTLKMIEARSSEIDSMDALIASYEQLKSQNKLTTDEMLRYLDISTELKNVKSEEAVKALTEEQQKLFEKSGLTNEEMAIFLEMNDKLVKEAPSTAKAISEQGNAYAAVTDELKKLNAEERQRLTDDTYMAITSEMNKQHKNLEKQKKLQEELKTLESDRTNSTKGILEQNEKIKELDLVIAGLRVDIENATKGEKVALAEKLHSVIEEKETLEGVKSYHEFNENSLNKQIDKKEQSLAKTEKELQAFATLSDKYAQMVLLEQGIVVEKGKAVEKIHEEQKAIDAARAKLEEKNKTQNLAPAIYDEANKKLDEQQRKIDTAKRKLEEMNLIAGQTVYKTVELKTDPSIDRLNERLMGMVSKPVRLALEARSKLPSYAVGTRSHPGGPALVGEEGFELAKLGNKWSMLDFGITNLPRGTQVFTHLESKKILEALNGIGGKGIFQKLKNIPAYAQGISAPGEAFRVIDDLSSRAININIISQLSGVITASKNVGKELMDTVGQVLTTGAQKINTQIAGIKNTTNEAMVSNTKKLVQSMAIALEEASPIEKSSPKTRERAKRLEGLLKNAEPITTIQLQEVTFA